MGSTEAIKCESCGGQVFDQALLLRKISPLLTGTGQPGLVPITVFVCKKCGKVIEEFLPEEMKGIYKEDE